MAEGWGKTVQAGPWGQPDGQPQQAFEPFAPIDLSRWQDREPPARQWMVEGCFPKGNVALLSGTGAIGKSLLMQQLCTAAVLGRSWLGMSVEPGRTVFLGCEDDQDEMVRRQSAINRQHNTCMIDVAEAGLFLEPRVGQDNALMRLDRLQEAQAAAADLTLAGHAVAVSRPDWMAVSMPNSPGAPQELRRTP